MPEESLKSKIGFSALTALLSGVVAFATLHYTNKLDQEKWERETSYASRQAILNKRIELLDLTLNAINTFHYMQLIQINADYDIRAAKVEIEKDIARAKTDKKFAA